MDYTCMIAHSIWKYQHLQTTSGKKPAQLNYNQRDKLWYGNSQSKAPVIDKTYPPWQGGSRHTSKDSA